VDVAKFVAELNTNCVTRHQNSENMECVAIIWSAEIKPRCQLEKSFLIINKSNNLKNRSS
jgi:hypothetical protein